VWQFYDFAIYGFFAPEIGKLFFPPASPGTQAMQASTMS
jgi:hypothetical protein